MSYGTPRLIQGLKSNGDTSADANLGKVVKISADNAIDIVTAITDVAVGILHCGNTAGKFVEVAGNGGGCAGQSGAAFAVGAELTYNTSGLLITATSATRVVAIAKMAATAANQFIDVEVVNYVKETVA